ncbi:MAG: GIY-YIG nuclease family protein [Caulobacteraceae bacterium]
MAFYVYIVASQRNGTIYVGSTDNLSRRVRQHKEGKRPGFTKTYGCDRLVWFESYEMRVGAFTRERRIKEWRRSWKLTLIEEDNPTWRDLFSELTA